MSPLLLFLSVALSVPVFQELFLPAFLDNYSYTTSTFSLRYFLSISFLPLQGPYPLLFYTGNEGDVELYVNNTGFMLEFATQKPSLVVFAEHRYYGKSLPYSPPFTTAQLKYFSPHQALADYAYLIAYLVDVYEVTEVVAFGGSYGGMLASWMRLKYPHLVDAALAASAPDLHFQQTTDPNLFAQTVTLPYSLYSNVCEETIRAGFQALAAAGEEDYYLLTQVFDTCDLVANSALLLDWAVDGLSNLAMLNYPYEANYTVLLPAWPVNYACSLLPTTPVQTSAEALAALYKAANVFYNYSGEAQCTQLSSNLTYGVDWLWSYVRCTTLIMPIGMDGVNDMFYSRPWDIWEFLAFCEERFGNIKSQVTYPTIMYGANNYTGNLFRYMSNVVFSNGEIDPWQSGGVFAPLNPALVPIYIPNAAHHLDLRASTPSDPPTLTSARLQETTVLLSWLS